MTMIEQNKVLMRTIVTIFNTGDVSQVDVLFAADYEDHQRPDGWDITGPEEFRQIVTGARNATQYLHVTIQDLIAEGDRVVARLRWQSADLAGVEVDRETIDILRVTQGQVAEHWGAETWRTVVN